MPTTKAGLLLAPGAGADRDQSTLVAIDDELTRNGFVVGRMDFPYRKKGRKAPDKQTVLVQAVVEELDALRKVVKSKPVFAGGRSMGGRMTSIAAAEGADLAGLVLISYPLHPPGKPEQLRTDHFPDITIPCIFISGTRDAFGKPEELENATKAIKGEVTHVWLEGGDHGLRKFDSKIVSHVRDWLTNA